MKPNIFDIATKELSQDGFITWLLLWGDIENKQYNPDLHKCGCDFASRLIKKEFPDFNEEIKNIQAGRQWKDIDIVTIVNNKYFIVIEDKTNTKQHSGQLERYKVQAEQWCKEKNYQLVCIYLKTGNESEQSLSSVTEKGYKLFNRKEFIDLLNSYTIDSDIFNDFKNRLVKIEQLNNEWETKTIKDWKKNDWQGFFQYLEKEIDIIDWGYVNNPNGGFWKAMLNWGACGIYPLYLQVQESRLHFKISTDPQDVKLPEGVYQGPLRDKITQILLETAKKFGINELQKPPYPRAGKHMTVAIIDEKYWLGEPDSKIDKEKVIANLKKYLEFSKKIVFPEQGK
jgi:hypothetical protein